MIVVEGEDYKDPPLSEDLWGKKYLSGREVTEKKSCSRSDGQMGEGKGENVQNSMKTWEIVKELIKEIKSLSIIELNCVAGHSLNHHSKFTLNHHNKFTLNQHNKFTLNHHNKFTLNHHNNSHWTITVSSQILANSSRTGLCQLSGNLF